MAHAARIGLLGMAVALACSDAGVAQSAPKAPVERQIFLPDGGAPAEAATAAAKPSSPPPKAARRRGARAAVARPAKPSAAKKAAPAKAVAIASERASAAAVPLPRAAPGRAGAGRDEAAVPVPPPPPHRRRQDAAGLSGMPPQAEADAPVAVPSDATMDVFAFVPPPAERSRAAAPSPAAAVPPPPDAQDLAPPFASVQPPTTTFAASPSRALPAAAEIAAAGSKSVARSVAEVFLQIENERAAGQIVLVPPATEPDARLLSPEPVLPPWRAAAAQMAKAAATALPIAIMPRTPEPAAPEPAAPEPVAPSPTPAETVALQNRSGPESASGPAADPPSAAMPEEPPPVPEPPPTAIPRYAAVPEPVRQLAESLPECAPDEHGTIRQHFGDRVLFVISCLGQGENQLRAFVLARKEDGEGANVLMFPRPGGGTGLPYMHQLSNPLVIGSRREITHLSVDPESRPCRTEGRWRVDTRGNAGLVSWRSAAACSGNLVASASSARPGKAAAIPAKRKSAKRPGRSGGKAGPYRKVRRR